MHELPNQISSQFVCLVGAIEPDKRQLHIELTRHLFRSVLQTQELLNGFAYQLPNEPDTLSKVVEFIRLEKLCCPFFGFAIEIKSDSEQIWLTLTGPEGVKSFIQSEFG